MNIHKKIFNILIISILISTIVYYFIISSNISSNFSLSNLNIGSSVLNSGSNIFNKNKLKNSSLINIVNNNSEKNLKFVSRLNLSEINSIGISLLYDEKKLKIENITAPFLSDDFYNSGNLEINKFNNGLIILKIDLSDIKNIKSNNISSDFKENIYLNEILNISYSKLNKSITDLIPAEIYYEDKDLNKIFLESSPISF